MSAIVPSCLRPFASSRTTVAVSRMIGEVVVSVAASTFASPAASPNSHERHNQYSAVTGYVVT